MRKLFASIIISLTIGITTYAQGLSRYELDVKDFSELKVVEGVNVTYICNTDSAGRAVFVASDDVASALIFNNTNNRLDIRIATNYITAKNLPSVTVYSKSLSKVENSGDSTVRVNKLAPCTQFKARLIGNGQLIVKDIDVTHLDGSIDTGRGQLEISGKVTSSRLSNTGVGTIIAKELSSEETKCVMLGSGTINCQAQKKLNIVGLSSGKVYYKGNPEEIKKHSVGVKVIPIEEEKEEEQSPNN